MIFTTSFDEIVSVVFKEYSGQVLSHGNSVASISYCVAGNTKTSYRPKRLFNSRAITQPKIIQPENCSSP
jgi:hypothetical protein